MGFPDQDEIRRELKKIEKREPTLVIDYENASRSDVLKYRLCQEFVKIMDKEKISQAELARRLGVDRSIVNKIVLHKIEVFTIDRLVDLLSSIRSIKIDLKAT